MRPILPEAKPGGLISRWYPGIWSLQPKLEGWYRFWIEAGFALPEPYTHPTYPLDPTFPPILD